jgi:2-polyprenyl-3-methyl-5-hydroxy-6-metoxy-1,4-benzoquinol methylase
MTGTTNDSTRQDWLRKTLAALPAGTRILDAGAGELRNRALCTHLKYVSQDNCQYEGVGDGVALHSGQWDTSHIDIVCDITAIPEPDNSFDVILCSEVLEHLPDALMALREFVRLTRPGGRIILTAPFASLTHMAPYHYISGFNTYWFRHHLESMGCEIIEVSANGNWFEFLAQEIRRIRHAASMYSSAPAGVLARALGGLLLLPLLGYLSKHDHGSAELMNHGWHVVARKK